MKKIFVTTAFAITFVSTSIAQKNVIKANPLGLLLGIAGVNYERALSDKGALEIGVSYASINADYESGEEAKANGFGIEGKYKFYFSSEKYAPRGWYFAPTATYIDISAEDGIQMGGISILGGGAVAGYQWVFGGGDSGFALDISLGAQYLSAEFRGDIEGTAVEGVLPKIGVGLGYSW